MPVILITQDILFSKSATFGGIGYFAADIYIYIYILSMVGLGDSAKQFFLVDPSFQCNLFTSSSGTNEIFYKLAI